MAYEQAEIEKASTRNRLKAAQNRSFAKVSQVIVEPIPEAPPTMGNPGMALMLGMGQAVAAGIGGMDTKTMDAPTTPSVPNVEGGMATGTYGSFMPSNPQFGFGDASHNFMGSPYQGYY